VKEDRRIRDIARQMPSKNYKIAILLLMTLSTRVVSVPVI
jgi:hypothetical protein